MATTANGARNRYEIKKDAEKIYKLSHYYRNLSEIGEALSLSETQVKKSLEVEEIFDLVMENLKQNNEIGNNFYFSKGKLEGEMFYLETRHSEGDKNTKTFVLKSDDVLHTDELIAIQPGDLVFEVLKKNKNIVISMSQITHQISQGKNIQRKVIEPDNQGELTGLEVAMISWI